MKITKRMALEVAYHEGLIRQAYKDSVGVWTWSVGLTNNSGHNVERYIDTTASMKRCIDVWLWAMSKYADDVEKTMGPLPEHQAAAALSFHWNTGAIKRATWVKNFNNGDLNSAYKNFMNYKRPPEIIPRRKAERDLFFKGRWTGDGTITEFTRLKSNYTPDWSSAVRVNVDKYLEE